jgi:hypothetical protein
MKYKRANGGHQARAVGMPLTLGNGKLLGLSHRAAIAERVACMPGLGGPVEFIEIYHQSSIVTNRNSIAMP